MELPKVKVKTILLGGGLDLESPQIAIKEGFAFEADNFETNLMGGYRKMLGYERLDGRPKPSEQLYYTMTVDDSSLESIDTDITGSLSGATARIVIKDDTLNIIGITFLSGSFDVGDVLLGGATVSVPESSSNYPDPDLDAVWELAAQDYYRSLIQPVAGVGSILGVWRFNGKEYAFRSNGTIVKMFESSTSGSQEVVLFELMTWDTGVFLEGDIAVGDTLVGVTSAATGTVKKLVKVSGLYGSTAAGYVVIETATGTFSGTEDIKKGATVVFTATSTADQISFTLGTNVFSFVNHNFQGSLATYSMYGCDGVNNAFEFDGTVLTPILTGMVTDAPTSIEVHKNHLFLAFAGGSLQHSAPSEPLIFNPILGAAEIGLGDDIGSLKSVGGNALLISTSKTVSGLYGSSVADWQLSLVVDDAGDYGNTLAVIGSPLMVTNRGIVRIDASQVYGNFESSTVSRLINPLLTSWLKNKTLIGTNIVRDKNQYRIYFSDGSGVILTHDALYGNSGTLPQFTTFARSLFPACLCSVATRSSTETVLIGGEDGYVYEEERGYSHDGGSMSYALRLPFHHLGSPSVRKAFKWIDVEIDAERNAELRLSYELSDGNSHTQVSALDYYVISGGSRAYWDEANWGEFNWNDDIITKSVTSMSGTGHNVSLLFYGNNALSAPFTINSVTYQYIPRRLNRG